MLWINSKRVLLNACLPISKFQEKGSSASYLLISKQDFQLMLGYRCVDTAMGECLLWIQLKGSSSRGEQGAFDKCMTHSWNRRTVTFSNTISKAPSKGLPKNSFSKNFQKKSKTSKFILPISLPTHLSWCKISRQGAEYQRENWVVTQIYHNISQRDI